jgi:hypothetical protein
LFDWSHHYQVHRLAQWVSSVTGSSDKVKFKAAAVRRKMLRFLRCAALYFHMVTDVQLPLNSDKIQNESDLYSSLAEYLALPKTLSQLIEDKSTMGLVDK